MKGLHLQAWALQVDVRVLDHHGNLHDAATLAAVAALMSFRRPEVSVGSPQSPQAFVVHPPQEREPLPLSLHHLPMPVTFALFEVRSWIWQGLNGARKQCVFMGFVHIQLCTAARLPRDLGSEGAGTFGWSWRAVWLCCCLWPTLG